MWYNHILKCVNNFLSTNPTTLILSSLVSQFWQRIQIWKEKNVGLKVGVGEVEGTLKPKQYARLSREVKYKTATIFWSTNPTTLILSSLLSEFRQRIQIWRRNNFFGWLVGGGRGGGGGGEGEEEIPTEKKPYNKYSLIFFVHMLYIKFQVPGSCGSLVLTQTKGVTDR